MKELLPFLIFLFSMTYAPQRAISVEILYEILQQQQQFEKSQLQLITTLNQRFQLHLAAHDAGISTKTILWSFCPI